MANCINGCGSKILWYTSYSHREKNIPINPIPVGKRFVVVEEDGLELAKFTNIFETHFATCPNNKDKHLRMDAENTNPEQVEPHSFTTICVRTRHTTDGTERRAYITLDRGNLVAVYSGNGAGENAITNLEHRDAYTGYTINVPVSGYEELLGIGRSDR